MEIIDKFVIDAHALIWHLEGNPKLGKRAKKVLDDDKSQLVLPIIAFAEAIDTVRKERTMILSVSELLQDVFSDSRIEIETLTIEILQESLNAMAVPKMHDRLICINCVINWQTGL